MRDVVRADPVERREDAAEDVIAGVDRAGPFERPEVGHLLDDDEGARIAARVAADHARVGGVDVAADRADDDLFDRDVHGPRQRHQKLVLLLDEMERGAARRPRPEPGKLGEKLDQALDLWTGDGTGHRLAFVRALADELVDEVGAEAAGGVVGAAHVDLGEDVLVAERLARTGRRRA